jgi:DnaK suppressor protein
MRASELTAIKNSLLSQKSDILNKSLEFKLEQASAGPTADEAEAASLDVDKTISIHLYERHRSALMQIERALGKISDGTYGQCESCGDEIEVKRLQVRPFASLCICCMEDREDKKPLYM